MKAPLYKHTMIVWADHDLTNGWQSGGNLEYIGREADGGIAYCSRLTVESVADPPADKDWDGTEFFGEDEDEGEDDGECKHPSSRLREHITRVPLPSPLGCYWETTTECLACGEEWTSPPSRFRPEPIGERED